MPNANTSKYVLYLMKQKKVRILKIDPHFVSIVESASD